MFLGVSFPDFSEGGLGMSLGLFLCVFLFAEYEEVKHLQRNNSRREERLKRVRAKNFQKKEEEVEASLHESIPQYTTGDYSIPQ